MEVLEGAHGNVGAQGGFLELVDFLDPWMLEGLLGAGSLVLILGEELCDEVFGLIRHVAPYSILEGDLAQLNFLHDLLVRSTIERRDTREDDVCDDAAGPDVALWPVVLGEHLRSDVIRSAQLLVELLVLIVDERSAEVNNLNLIEFFVLLEQDVFWLQVPVHNVVAVAVIYAR